MASIAMRHLSSMHCTRQLCIHHPSWNLIYAPLHGNSCCSTFHSSWISPSLAISSEMFLLISCYMTTRSQQILESSTCPEFSWVSHYQILDSAPQILSHGILSIVFDFLTYLHDTWPDANKILAFFFSFLFQNLNTNQVWHFQCFLESSNSSPEFKHTNVLKIN